VRIYLRAFELEDYKKINEWRRYPEIIAKTGGSVFFVSSEKDKKWVEEKIFNDQSLYLAICLKENDEMIGYLSVVDIDWRNRKAQWGGITIGRKDLWNQGYAKEAARLMLEYVFREMGLHRFYGHWLESHGVSIKMGERLGFNREGILKDSVFKNGRFHNLVVMSLLKDEFEGMLETDLE